MNRFLELPQNKHGRDFVIGDIHGRYNELMYGLELVNFNFSDDRLFSVGDLVDRGKQNMQILDLIGELWFYPVLGNHEEMMLNGIRNGSTMPPYAKSLLQFWVSNGGDWFYDLNDMDLMRLKSYHLPLLADEVPVGLEFIAENGKRVGITHAGIPRASTWMEVRDDLKDISTLSHRTVQECLWTRTKIQSNNFDLDVLGVDLLIHGHTPSIEEVWKGNTVFIDLGACNNNQLNPINVMDLLNRQDKNEHYAWRN